VAWGTSGNVPRATIGSAPNFPQRWQREVCGALKFDPVGTNADVFALSNGFVELAPSIPQKPKEPIGRGWALQLYGRVENLAVDRQSPTRCNVYAHIAAIAPCGSPKPGIKDYGIVGP
jgi:hypothetical protein